MHMAGKSAKNDSRGKVNSPATFVSQLKKKKKRVCVCVHVCTCVRVCVLHTFVT